MRHTLAALLVPAIGLAGCLSGCAAAGQPRPVAEPATVTAATTAAAPAAQPTAQPAPGALPPPEALTAVLDRLADPALPGADKLALVAGSSAPDAAALDRFATALRDGGYSPATFTAGDIRWSPDDLAAPPPRVLATITVTPANPAANPASNPASAGPFAFPMEFEAADGVWQLTRDTAEMLFAFGEGR